MNHLAIYSKIKATDTFTPSRFPEIDQEIHLVKAEIKGLTNANQCELAISFFRDHRVRVDLVQSEAMLVRILLSMTTCRHIEALFQASSQNNGFRSDFEDYLKNRLST